MPGKHGLFDSLKHIAFEDDPEKPPAGTAPAAHPAAAPSFPAPSFAQPFTPAAEAPQSAYTPPIGAGVVPDNDEAYRRLLSRTDFETTDVAATIHKYLEPLKAIPDNVMSPNIKFRTAVIQAQAQAGLTQDAILAVFDALQSRLQQEKDTFETKAQQFSSSEVTGRQDRIGQISAQITQLQQQLAQLSAELADAQGKSAYARSQFAAAAQRRASEIEQQKAQYASMLKG
jgi:ribosome-associated translation inhibitor RaiA